MWYHVGIILVSNVIQLTIVKRIVWGGVRLGDVLRKVVRMP